MRCCSHDWISPQADLDPTTTTGQRLPANNNPPNDAITKDFIRQRLSWIMTAYPAASPSRATLQSVNAFLFSPREKFPPPSAPPTPSTEKPMPTTPLSQTFATLTTTTTSTPWTLARTLTSHLPPSSGGTPSGSFAGTATFAPRGPTAAGYAAECLYSEEGVLRTETGLEVQARRRYVWRYRDGSKEEEQEGISIWFVKEDGESVDYLFLDMEFQGGGGEGGGDKRLRAKGRHPCGRDVYDAEFVFGGEPGEEGMVVTYVVKGPKKDYISETRYTR